MPIFGMKPLPSNPNFERLLIEAQRAFDAMTPDQQKEMRREQRKSWVIGEVMLEHPSMTREEAEEVYQKVVEGMGL